MWRLRGFKESPIDSMQALRKEFGYGATLCNLIVADHKPATGEELIRRIKFGLIEVPTEEEAQAEMKRRKKQDANERRKATIARKKALAEKVIQGPW